MLLPVLIMSCHEPKINDEVVVRAKLDIRLSGQELDSLKSFIIEQYWEHDSIYFSASDNCYFKQFIENELESFGHYFDTVFQGMSIKHYFFPYTNFRFNLVRGSDGAFYYVGLSDWQYVFEGIVNTEYTEVSKFQYGLNTDKELTFIELNASTEVAFNRIFEQDTLFHFKSSSDSFRAMRLAEGFVYHNYVQERTGYPFVPAFSRSISPKYLMELMEKYKGGKLTEKELSLGETYRKLNYNFMNERVNLYELDRVGILSFHFRKEIGEISIKESLFPAKSRPYISLNPAIDSLIDWSLYEECRDKH